MAITPGANYLIARGRAEALQTQGHTLSITVDPIGLTATCTIKRKDGQEWAQTFSGEDLPPKIHRLYAFRDHPLSVLITFAVNEGCDWSHDFDVDAKEREEFRLARQRAEEKRAAREAERNKWR